MTDFAAYPLRGPAAGFVIVVSMSLSDFLQTVYRPGHLGIGSGALNQMAIAVRLLDRWAKHPVRVSELSNDLLLGFLSDYLQNRSPATVNAKRRFLLALWRYACKKGHPIKPPNDVPKIREHRREPEGWTPDEIERIIVTARQEAGVVGECPAGLWWASLLLVVYSSGERIGALRQVLHSDVSFSHRGIFVRGEFRKTGRDKWRPLPDVSVAACAGIIRPTRERFWPWPYTREWLDERLRRILRRSNVSYGRARGGLFNKFRRSAGSHIEANGGDGSKHLDNTRAVFDRHYLDPRLADSSQIDKLPPLDLN